MTTNAPLNIAKKFNLHSLTIHAHTHTMGCAANIIWHKRAKHSLVVFCSNFTFESMVKWNFWRGNTHVCRFWVSLGTSTTFLNCMSNIANWKPDADNPRQDTFHFSRRVRVCASLCVWLWNKFVSNIFQEYYQNGVFVYIVCIGKEASEGCTEIARLIFSA